MLILLLSVSGFCSASGIRELEEVTIKVIGLEEVPESGVPLIQLPDPDLGEMKDRMETVNPPPAGPVPAEIKGTDTVVAPGTGASSIQNP